MIRKSIQTVLAVACIFSICTQPLLAQDADLSEGMKSETGLASWYGPGLHQNRTAGGEIFDMDALTAAHPTLPFDTRVRVTNLKNKRSVIVRINDRGPFINNRIIDVSMEAARKLDILDSGTARVKVEVVDDEIVETIRVSSLPAPISKKSIGVPFGVTRPLDQEAYFNLKRKRNFPYVFVGNDEAD